MANLPSNLTISNHLATELAPLIDKRGDDDLTRAVGLLVSAMANVEQVLKGNEHPSPVLVPETSTREGTPLEIFARAVDGASKAIKDAPDRVTLGEGVDGALLNAIRELELRTLDLHQRLQTVEMQN